MPPIRAATFNRLVVAMLLAAANGCAYSSAAHATQAPLAVQIAVTNESGQARRFELRVNGVVVKDTVVGRPRDLTGMVMNDYVRLVPGSYELVLVDHYSHQQFTARLTVKPRDNCIRIALMGTRTEFDASNAGCIFA